MGLFSNKKTVAAIFDNDADIDKAIEALQELGYGRESDDEITIIDHHQFEPETTNETVRVVPAAGVGSTTPGAGAVITEERQNGETLIPTDTVINDIKNKLSSVGIKNEEADFFTQRVVRGATLVTVKVDPNDVPRVEEIFSQAGQVYAEKG
ncbi:MAG: hypothetical protein KDJ65_21805 [Anaerolineae bacterium]|nr:hypothetical protein [Anaerolineae bacterium]